MNTTNTILIFALTFCSSIGIINAQNVTIPDANFKNCLVTNRFINTNQDGEIQISEAENVLTLECGGRNIADLTGIEAFINLKKLRCANNQLVRLNLSRNLDLEYLDCPNNQLASLDLRPNAKLEYLDCFFNELTNLNLSQNTKLVLLHAGGNQLTSLNLKNGHNRNIILLNVCWNPNLTCIEVDDPIYSESNIHWNGEDRYRVGNAFFSTDCETGEFSTSTELPNVTTYPNPTTNGLTLNLGKVYSSASIQVRNVTSGVVLSKKLANVSSTILELEGAAGVYFINIETEEGTKILKVVKK